MIECVKRVEDDLIERKEKIFTYVAWHLGISVLHHMVVMINTKDGKLHHRSYQIRHLCAIRSTAQYIYRLAALVPTALLNPSDMISRMI